MILRQVDKANAFVALHQGPAAFIIPTPWDGGSARLLAGLGFQALATSSGALPPWQSLSETFHSFQRQSL